MRSTTLALSGASQAELRRHLFPGDGCEAAAILLCTRAPGPDLRMLVRDVLPVPYDVCAYRERDRIGWPGRFLEAAIEQGEPEDLSLVLLHSHPGGHFLFSKADDASDLITMQSLFQAYGDCHGSAIMTPDGAMRARIYRPGMKPLPVDLVTCAGDDIHFWWDKAASAEGPGPRPVAFTSAMTSELSQLTAVVIGVSGTGSVQAEQAARLGFGQVILIDFDRVKKRNLNRILNTTLADARAKRLKTETFAGAITSYRGAWLRGSDHCIDQYS